MRIYSSVSGVNKEIKEHYGVVGGANKNIKEIYGVDGGINRKVYNGALFSLESVPTDGVTRAFAGLSSLSEFSIEFNMSVYIGTLGRVSTFQINGNNSFVIYAQGSTAKETDEDGVVHRLNELIVGAYSNYFNVSYYLGAPYLATVNGLIKLEVKSNIVNLYVNNVLRSSMVPYGGVNPAYLLSGYIASQSTNVSASYTNLIIK